MKNKKLKLKKIKKFTKTLNTLKKIVQILKYFLITNITTALHKIKKQIIFIKHTKIFIKP